MNDPVIILHLEDNPRDAELVRHLLQQTDMTFTLRLARNRAEYEAALAETTFDLILSDYELPGYDGLTALKLAAEKQPNVPFILVTGALGEEQAVDTMLLGATDYVLKQRLHRLVPAVLRALAQANEGQKRHVLEELFHASELRYRRLFETAKDGILILDAETGMVVDVNPYLIEMLGYTHAVFLGKKIWELGFFKNIVANQDNFAELQRKEYIRYEDMALETSDGRRIEVEFVSNVYLVNHQKVIQCNIRDITQRTAQKREIERQTRLYATLSQINHKITHVKSREELFREVCLITANSGGFKVVWVGRRTPETQQVVPVARGGKDEGYLDSIKVYADDRPEGRGPVGTCIREDRPCVFNNFFNVPAALPWCEAALAHGLRAAAALPIHFKGEVWGAFTVYDEEENAFQDKEAALLEEAAMDISFAMENLDKEAQRQAAETAMRASELRYRRLFESAKDGILILDAETGMIVDVNPFLIEMLGYSHEVFLGKKVWELGFFKNIVANQDNFVELQQKAYIRYEDMALETSDGRRIEVEFVSNVYLVNGHKVIQCNIRDISERHRAAAEILKLNTELEQRVTERTAELQAANKELETFSYSISHDLRAPLRSISGFADMLTEDHAQQIDEEGRRLLGVICGEAKRMDQMIDELLAFSRLGRHSMQVAETDMTALAQSAFDQCAAQASGRNVQFKLQPLPPAHSDPHLLSHVWSNLISNAIKYTRTKPVAEIEITGCAKDGEIVYCVKDNGVGFDMKYAQKLFAVFQRLHADADFEGIGVGLALAQHIVQRHNGRIWAEAEVNKGATFYFTLPLKSE